MVPEKLLKRLVNSIETLDKLIKLHREAINDRSVIINEKKFFQEFDEADLEHTQALLECKEYLNKL